MMDHPIDMDEVVDEALIRAEDRGEALCRQGVTCTLTYPLLQQH